MHTLQYATANTTEIPFLSRVFQLLCNIQYYIIKVLLQRYKLDGKNIHDIDIAD